MAAEVALTYKSTIPFKERFQVQDPKEVMQIVKAFHKDDMEVRERFYAAYFNHSNQLLGVQEVSSGGITGTVVDLRILFSAALKLNATQIIVWHNHPSGKTTPSHQDKSLARKIEKAAEVLDIRVLDNIVVNSEYDFEQIF